MKPSTKNEINGNIHEVKGAVKETTGKITNNPTLRPKAKPKQPRQGQKKVGQIEKVLEK